MNIELLLTLASVIGVSLISLVGLFAIPMHTLFGKRTLVFLVSFSAGALLGDVFIHLLPELAEESNLNLTTSLYILGSIFVFFLLEKYFVWHHHHGEGEVDEHAPHAYVYNVLFGDSVHNMIDGLVIAGAYQIDLRLGLATTVAVVLHEIPQEIGDFGVLIYGGFTKKKALIYNLISGLSAVAGALFAFAISNIAQALPILAALGAGSFIYIALADLIPQVHKEKGAPTQVAAFMLGIATMLLLLLME